MNWRLPILLGVVAGLITAVLLAITQSWFDLLLDNGSADADDRVLFHNYQAGNGEHRFEAPFLQLVLESCRGDAGLYLEIAQSVGAAGFELEGWDGTHDGFKAFDRASEREFNGMPTFIWTNLDNVDPPEREITLRFKDIAGQEMFLLAVRNAADGFRLSGPAVGGLKVATQCEGR